MKVIHPVNCLSWLSQGLCAAAFALLLGAGWANVQGAAPPPASPFPADQAAGVVASPRLSWGIGDLEAVSNGGFESGTPANWSFQAQGGFFGTFEINDGTLDVFFQDQPVQPLEGAYCGAAYRFNGTLVAFTDVAVPAIAGDITLRWFHHLLSTAGYTPDHRFRVEIRNPLNNAVLAVLYSTEDGQVVENVWSKHSADLSDFGGQTVRLAFAVYGQQGFLMANFDSVSIQLRAEEGLESDVYLGTSPSLTGNNLLGSTSDNTWSISDLAPQTTYYWRVVTHSGLSVSGGPVWQFTTGSPGPMSRLVWDPVTSPQIPSAIVNGAISARDTLGFQSASFTGSAQLRAASIQPTAGSGVLLPNAPYTAFTTITRATVGYAFTPTTNLWVTAVRAYSGDRVSIWNEEGDLLARQTVQVTTPGWLNIPLTQAVLLQGGHRYRIGVYNHLPTSQFTRFDGPSNFAHGTLDQSYESPGDAFPSQSHPARWWFVDLVYQVAQFTPLTVAPDVAGSFQEGLWTGSITLPNSTASPLVLIAESENGIVGMSNPINITEFQDEDSDGMEDSWELANDLDPTEPSDAFEDEDLDRVNNLGEYQAGTDPNDPSSRFLLLNAQAIGLDVTLELSTAPNRRHLVERTTDLASGNWVEVINNLMGDGGVTQVQDPGAASLGAAFYRAQLVP